MMTFDKAPSAFSSGHQSRVVYPLANSFAPTPDARIPHTVRSLAVKSMIRRTAENIARIRPICTSHGKDMLTPYASDNRFAGFMPFAVKSRDIRDQIASGPTAAFWGITGSVT